MNKYYILANKRSIPSAKLLKDSIGKLLGKRIFVTSDENKYKNAPIVRYGNSFGKFSGDTSMNSTEFIRILSNKRKFSELMTDAGLYCPQFFKSTEKIKSGDIFPVLIRTALSLSGGKGIIFCNNEEEFYDNWNSKYCWTPFIPLQWELRAHILGGDVLKIFRKTWEKDIPEPKNPIRNNSSYGFRLRENKHYPKLLKLIPTINDIFGKKNFYALDIGWDTVSKKYCFIEGNTAPGLNEKTADMYAEYILKQIKL